MVRIVDSATATYLQARQGVIPRNFVWITAKNISTGLPEEIGFWDGIDTVDVTVVSGSTGLPVTRTYHAWGSLLKIDNIQRTPEIAVRNVKIGLSSISPEVRQAFRGYNTRLAPIEVHRGFLDLDSRQLIAPPIVRLVGWINKAPVKTPAVGSEGGIEATVVSHARLLTRTNPGKRSDETQKLRDGDRFRRYANVAADWEFWWGEKRGKISDSVPTAPKEVFKGGA